MAVLRVIIHDEIDAKFRKKAAEKFGLKKDSMKKAVEEALSEWTEKKKVR